MPGTAALNSNAIYSSLVDGLPIYAWKPHQCGVPPVLLIKVDIAGALMKTITCTLFFLCATTVAFSQNASVLTNEVQPIRIDGHVQHASEHPMALESSLLSSGSYSYAKGEVPLADLASPIYETPLGDVARTNRKERADSNAPKAARVMED
jgi:hypothetical protein